MSRDSYWPCLAPLVLEPRIAERLAARGAVAQVHDLPVSCREDGEELAVQLDAGELLAGLVVDTEDDVVTACDELERVHLMRVGGAGAQPGKDLVAPPAEIGRASCRERGWHAVGEGSVKE